MIQTPSRLHLTLTDLSGSSGRVDGGVGIWAWGGTQMGIAAGAALCELYGRPLPVREISRINIFQMPG